MNETSRYSIILIMFSFILTILSFTYNISLANTTRSKHLIHISVDDDPLRYPSLTSYNFTINLSISCSENIDTAHLYLLVGNVQSKINESKTQISFSNFTKALSQSFIMSSSELYSLEFNFLIDIEDKTLLINYESQIAIIKLKEIDGLRIVFITTSSEIFGSESISLDTSKSAWVSLWWKS